MCKRTCGTFVLGRYNDNSWEIRMRTGQCVFGGIIKDVFSFASRLGVYISQQVFLLYVWIKGLSSWNLTLIKQLDCSV